MSDDIVARLRNVMDSCPHHRPGVGSQIMPECDRCEVELEAGHEIARLRAEVAELHDGINWHTTCFHCAKLMNDIYDQHCEIERLRQTAGRGGYVQDLLDEIELAREKIERQQNEIERLRAEVARLGAFLHPIGEQARRG